MSINSMPLENATPGLEEGTYKSLEHPTTQKAVTPGASPGGPVAKTLFQSRGYVKPWLGERRSPILHSSRACAPQLLSPCAPEAAPPQQQACLTRLQLRPDNQINK